jgi:hypothetical protein
MPTVSALARDLLVGGLLGSALFACERAAPVALELPRDAALAPVVLVPPPEPLGISRFDCTGTAPGQSAQWLRLWKGPGAAGAATNLKGHALACELSLRSDCAGQAELRVTAGLARSEKVVTAVSVGKAVTVSLRLDDEAWEKALEPVEGRPYQHILQLVARAEVSCAAPVDEPHPRYWTASFISGVMGPKLKLATSEGAETAVDVKDGPAQGEGEETPAPAAPPSPAPTASARGSASERAAERAARRERKKKPAIDLNVTPPAAEASPSDEE